MEVKTQKGELDNFSHISKLKFNQNLTSYVYDSKKDFFDPSKASPPNEFMIKLIQRMENIKKNQTM